MSDPSPTFVRAVNVVHKHFLRFTLLPFLFHPAASSANSDAWLRIPEGTVNEVNVKEGLSDELLGIGNGNEIEITEGCRADEEEISAAVIGK